MVTQTQRRALIAAAFKNHTIATRYESVIAAAMHKHEGLNGKLPKKCAHTAISPQDYRTRYSRLLEDAPRNWTRTKDMAALWGMPMQSASQLLQRMMKKNLIDSRSVSGHRQWRAKA